MTLDYGSGGYDLEFTMPSIPDGDSIRVYSDIAIAYSQQDGSYIGFETVGTDLILKAATDDNTLIESYNSGSAGANEMTRVVFHNEFCTIYMDSQWVHTFAFPYVNHPEYPNVAMRTGNAGLTVTDVRLKELSDWREAIWVDIESNTINAIRTLILQRPVEIYPYHTGCLTFEYNSDRETVSLEFIKTYDIDEKYDPKACSDAIIYYSDVAVKNDNTYAAEEGFVTRMYRLPDIDNGAIRAATVMLLRNRQSMKIHKLTARLDPEIELGDIGSVVFTSTGTATSVSESFIVESIRVHFRAGEQQMVLEGRDAGS